MPVSVVKAGKMFQKEIKCEKDRSEIMRRREGIWGEVKEKEYKREKVIKRDRKRETVRVWKS